MEPKIDRQLDSILRRVEKPARYIGGETNIVRKDPQDVDLRFGFAFPDTYEIGMSYMGLQILYDILNREKDIYCERIFAPAVDMEEIMRAEGRRLFSLETLTPAVELDILGFTLQYEMSFTNVLNMLDLAGLPLRSRDRFGSSSTRSDYPLVIAGGPCAFNPEPMADFIDAFLIGDGEELLPEICREYISLKKEYEKAQTAAELRPVNNDTGFRLEFLRRIAGLEGVYVPMFYEPVYNDDGTLEEMKVIDEAAPARVSRALVSDIETVAFPKDNLVPLIDTVHDRSVVETFRGCTRGCRFCQAGMIYRPVRERKPENVVKTAMDQLDNTGHEELSLLSLSTSDHSSFEPMAIELMGRCRERNVALSLPSLRLDSFSFRVLDEIQGYRKSGLTFAPEAGTQRLRDVINKNITEEDIYSATRQAIELGWETIKLYFMIGLPTETDEDLDGIARIAKNIVDINYDIRGRKGGRFRVTVSVSNFVPKAHTPFQWVSQDTSEEFIRKHDYLAHKLKIKGVTYNYHESNTSRIEAVFARGDRRCCDALEKAYRLGCRFDAWSEHFDEKKWERAFEESGLDTDLYTVRRRRVDEVLPWDHIDPFVDRSYLEEEYKKATKAQVTPDCREGCTGCGMNRHTKCFVNRVDQDMAGDPASDFTSGDSGVSGRDGSRKDSPENRRKYAIEFSKTGTICYTSHLDLMRMFKRAFKRAGITLAYSQGFNPHPKMGFAQPLSLGYWSMSEYIEFEVTDAKITSEEIMGALSEILPEGIRIIRCLCIDGLKKTLASHTLAAEYMIEIPFSDEDAPSVYRMTPQEIRKAYMERESIPALKRQKKTKELKEIDIKPMIRDISFDLIEDPSGRTMYINALLDSGSASNLSPELVIASALKCFDLEVDRSRVSVMRKRIVFDKETQAIIG